MKSTLFSLIKQAIAQTVIPQKTSANILAYAQNRAYRLFARKVTFFASAAIAASIFVVPMLITTVENNHEIQNKILQAKLDRLCEYTLLSVTHFKIKPVTVDFDL